MIIQWSIEYPSLSTYYLAIKPAIIFLIQQLSRYFHEIAKQLSYKNPTIVQQLSCNYSIQQLAFSCPAIVHQLCCIVLRTSYMYIWRPIHVHMTSYTYTYDDLIHFQAERWGEVLRGQAVTECFRRPQSKPVSLSIFWQKTSKRCVKEKVHFNY